jgi:hypothetical protein
VGADLNKSINFPHPPQVNGDSKLEEPEETGPDLLLRPSPVKSPPMRSFPTSFSIMSSGMKLEPLSL